MPDEACVFLGLGRTYGDHFLGDPSTAVPVPFDMLEDTAGHGVRARSPPPTRPKSALAHVLMPRCCCRRRTV